jgi:prophage regulatory protein
MIELLRLRDVLNARGRGRTSHYSDVRRGLFTKQVQIGENAVAWPAHEVDLLNRARVAGKSDDEIRELVRQLETSRKTAVGKRP